MQSDSPQRAPFVRSGNPIAALLDAIPLTVLVLAIAMWWLGWPATANSDGEVPPLKPISASSTEQLEGIFTQSGYFWPAREIPAFTLTAFPHDLDTAQPDQRKSLFFRSLLPIILAENQRIEDQRHQLYQALGDQLPKQRRYNIIQRLAQDYGVDGKPLEPTTWQALKQRINTVPVALALAQAAKESGWGTSRFARQGNNLFGEWTWEASRGIKPKDRADEAKHYVRAFGDLRASVRSYMNNLNSHRAYERFRFLRERARQGNRVMSPSEMTAGLENYSQRGWPYVKEVQALIQSNQLHQIARNVSLVDQPDRLAVLQ